MGEKWILSILGVLITGLAFGGWSARDYVSKLATKEDVKVAGTKADYALDRQMTAILRDINRIEDKTDKTVDDREQLKFLRDTLKEMREVRRGK